MSDDVPGAGGTAETSLSNLLTDAPKAAIITALVSEAGNERNPSQVCRRADIDLETFYDHIDALEDAGLVRYTYIVGNGPVYEIERTALADELATLAGGTPQSTD